MLLFFKVVSSIYTVFPTVLTQFLFFLGPPQVFTIYPAVPNHGSSMHLGGRMADVF